MTLAELITALEAEDPRKVVLHGFTHPHSYRGDYMDLAFEPARNVSVSDMLAAARSALGATYQGWKGGDYEMSEYTDCWLSVEGSAAGETIGPLLLKLMLAAVPSAPMPETPETATCNPDCPTWGMEDPDDDPAHVRAPSPMSTETPETAKIPAELIDVLGERIHDGWHEGCEETGCNGATRAQADEVAHDHLAAVLPAHEAMVVPPGHVVVREDDLKAYLNRGTTGDVLREVHALRRLLTAIGERP